jgi:hypothetical protein
VKERKVEVEKGSLVDIYERVSEGGISLNRLAKRRTPPRRRDTAHERPPRRKK